MHDKADNDHDDDDDEGTKSHTGAIQQHRTSSPRLRMTLSTRVCTEEQHSQEEGSGQLAGSQPQ